MTLTTNVSNYCNNCTFTLNTEQKGAYFEFAQQAVRPVVEPPPYDPCK